ncbi:prokineticin domain-containing protein [Purpureocillium lilacinum]|uniref:Prokineticin domain-containing protein n=1 Tax=Purpureocillium lilacinum TaxID=33203 RepID=A0A179HCL3_PURLI|nr:prokineticin domain-containing protein [Purpureocillium lilacinum]
MALLPTPRLPSLLPTALTPYECGFFMCEVSLLLRDSPSVGRLVPKVSNDARCPSHPSMNRVPYNQPGLRNCPCYYELNNSKQAEYLLRCADSKDRHGAAVVQAWASALMLCAAGSCATHLLAPGTPGLQRPVSRGELEKIPVECSSTVRGPNIATWSLLGELLGSAKTASDSALTPSHAQARARWLVSMRRITNTKSHCMSAKPAERGTDDGCLGPGKVTATGGHESVWQC